MKKAGRGFIPFKISTTHSNLILKIVTRLGVVAIQEVRLIQCSDVDPHQLDADPYPDPLSAKPLMRIRLRPKNFKLLIPSKLCGPKMTYCALYELIIQVPGTEV